MSIQLNGLHIEQVTYTKFLGLYIDNEITWKYHVNQVSSKIAKMTGIIGKAKTSITYLAKVYLLYIIHIIMLFTCWAVRIGRNCTQGLEVLRPRAQFLPIRTNLGR